MIAFKRKKPVTPDEFWDRVDKTDSCWNWTGYRMKYGYGLLCGRLTHRIAYEFLVGEIPDGLVVDHLCKNTSCVNPAHLDIVTQGTNARRGRNFGLYKTHCPSGHPYSGHNLTTISTTGWRKCKACNAANMRKALRLKRMERV